MMIAMALIVRLPTIWIGILGAAIIGLHNLLDSVSPGSLGKAAGLWTFLHVPGLLSITPHISVLVGYTLIPWVGVMAAGYALGALLEKPDRRKRIFILGVGLTLAFFLLRFINLYGNGDPSHPSFYPWTVGPWKFQANPTLTVIAFLNTLKYPPSLDHLLMALGPALIILAGLDGLRAERSLGRIMLVFGRVPLFFYVVHVFLIHTSAVLVGLLFHQPRLLALAGRICSESRTCDLWSSLSLCLRDLAADAGDSLPPLQMVRCFQEPSSGLAALKLRLDSCALSSRSKP